MGVISVKKKDIEFLEGRPVLLPVKNKAAKELEEFFDIPCKPKLISKEQREKAVESINEKCKERNN